MMQLPPTNLTRNVIFFVALMGPFLFRQWPARAVTHRDPTPQWEQGTVATFDHLRLGLDVYGPRGLVRRDFLIAQTKSSSIDDDVRRGDRVNVGYLNHSGDLIVISLQQVPQIRFDQPAPGSGGAILGSELMLPDSESNRLMAMVDNPITPRTRAWLSDQTTAGEGATGGGGGGGDGGVDSGIVLSIQKLNSVESKLVVNMNKGRNPPHLITYLLDLTTRVHGVIRTGARVIVYPDTEGDSRYASVVDALE
jgi:hypothetical protein